MSDEKIPCRICGGVSHRDRLNDDKRCSGCEYRTKYGEEPRESYRQYVWDCQLCRERWIGGDQIAHFPTEDAVCDCQYQPSKWTQIGDIPSGTTDIKYIQHYEPEP